MILKLWKKTAKDYLVQIKVDNASWGSLNQRDLRGFDDIPCEAEIDDASLEDIKQKLYNCAQNKLFDYLSKFERCSHQAVQYLRKYHFADFIISDIVAKATELGYIDDARYAEILIRSLVERNKSRNYIVSKLYEHHLDPELYQTLLDEYIEPQRQQNALDSELQKLLWRYSTPLDTNSKQKIIASLYRKGFDIESIKEAIAEL